MSILNRFRRFCRRFYLWGYVTYITIPFDSSRSTIGVCEQKFRKFNEEMRVKLAENYLYYYNSNETATNTQEE